MAIDRVVALNVTDEAGYQQYRDEMTPLLHAYGGGFRHDFRVAEVLRSDVTHPVNRLFVIHFPSTEEEARFFADERYLAVRKAHFERSVEGATVLGVMKD